MDDTIAAISTSIGTGGIAVIRISGKQALNIADALFCGAGGKPSSFNSHTVHYGTIGHGEKLVDEVLLTVMRGPKTYTREDVVEISCHGGSRVTRSVLERCLQNGARLAEPGEFTQRAFLNGRIDLAQAEAVMDLIQAKTIRAQQSAVNGLQGQLSMRISSARHGLLEIIAHLEAHLDFPDEDIPAVDWQQQIIKISDNLRNLLATARRGQALREGVSVVLVGRPNAGKSSLMNALVGRERSIVTHLPGTTRDTIEELVDIQGVPVRLTDTAGLRKPKGQLEQSGIDKTLKSLYESYLALHVIDSSRPYSSYDETIATIHSGKPIITVLSKADLPRKLILPTWWATEHCVEVSAISNTGIDSLCRSIVHICIGSDNDDSRSETYLNVRQADAIRRALTSIAEALGLMQDGSGIDLVSSQLRAAIENLNSITGNGHPEEILREVFSKFCIGK